MSNHPALSEVIESIGHPEIFDTLLAYLQARLPHCQAIVASFDAGSDQMRILAHTSGTAQRMALDDYSRSTHILDPFNFYMNKGRESVVLRAQDLPPPDRKRLERYKSIGVPIVLDNSEHFNYRTRNWYPRMDELRLKFGLIDEVTLQIALFRNLQHGGFERESVQKLSAMLPALKSAIQLHSFCDRTSGDGKSGRGESDVGTGRTAHGVAPTPRQLDVFRWWAAGKTLEDIATILGIKRRTVRYHMEKARELYGYSTVQQTAVRIAQDYNLDPLTGSLPQPDQRGARFPDHDNLRRMVLKEEWVA